MSEPIEEVIKDPTQENDGDNQKQEVFCFFWCILVLYYV